MKIFFLAFLFLANGSLALAQETNSPKKELKTDPFSVSTEDFDDADSLNRVAGIYDRGYSSPEQSFRAKDHMAGAGPFAREKAETPKY